MSITFEDDLVCVLDHDKYIASVYNSVWFEGNLKQYSHLLGLFSIKNPFSAAGKRKRNTYTDCGDVNDEVLLLKTLLAQLKNTLKVMTPPVDDSEDIDAKELSKNLFQQTCFSFGTIQGGNNSNKPLRCCIKNEPFLMPPKCRFICGDVIEQVKQIDTNTKFDLVVADPPWWNKYIRRLKTANRMLSYSMMYNEDIASIPLSPLLSENCLIAVWCTNSPSNISAVKNSIFPAWGITYATTWYWLKVTRSMEPICSFGTNHMKQPFERIILGTKGNVNVPDKKLIVSVPSCLHSHKPPLLEVLKKYSDISQTDPRMLELFARYLLPGTTSLGFEPLKWQHISLYKELDT